MTGYIAVFVVGVLFPLIILYMLYAIQQSSQEDEE